MQLFSESVPKKIKVLFALVLGFFSVLFAVAPQFMAGLSESSVVHADAPSGGGGACGGDGCGCDSGGCCL